MTRENLKTLLQEKLSGPVNEQLLDFIIEHAHLLPLWSVEDICRKADVRKDEFFALLTALDVPSFAGFRDFLRQMLYHEDNCGQENYSHAVRNVVQEMIENEMKSLAALSQDIDYKGLDRLTYDIAQAEDVLVIGNGGAAPYALYLEKMLSKLGVKAHILNPYSGLTTVLSSHNRSTLIISFGIARYAKQSVLQLQTLRQRGFKIVGFTDRQDSPWVDFSDYCFFMPLQNFDFLDSYTVGITLINALLLNMSFMDKQRLITQLNAYDAAAEDLDLMF